MTKRTPTKTAAPTRVVSQKIDHELEEEEEVTADVTKTAGTEHEPLFERDDRSRQPPTRLNYDVLGGQ